MIGQENFSSDIDEETLTKEFLSLAKKFSAPNEKSFTILAPSISADAHDFRSRLFIYNSQNNHTRKMFLPLRHAHFAVFHPTNTALAIVVEFRWNRACLVNWKEETILKTFEATGGHVFGGHAFFSADGLRLFMSEYPANDTTTGKIVIRNLSAGCVVEWLDTFAMQPHEFFLDTKEEKIIVGHYGRGPYTSPIDRDGGVTVIDIKTKKLLFKFSPSQKNINLCHIDRISDNRVFASSRDWIKGENYPQKLTEPLLPWEAIALERAYSSPVYIASLTNGELQEFMPPKLKEKMLYNFSTKTNAVSKTAVVAHLLGNAISFWNTENGMLLKRVGLPFSAVGVALTPNKSHFIVQTGDGAFTFWNTSTLEFSGSRASALITQPSPHIDVIENE